MFVSDYVLMEYGTGAIMAVPAHDQRDYEFAVKFGLPVRHVVAPKGDAGLAGDEAFTAHTEDERLINSGDFTGMDAVAGRDAIVACSTSRARARERQLRLRDWLVSRQRYWGCPIPVVYCQGGCGMVPVPEEELPVELPEIEDYQPRGQSPLAAATDWVKRRVPQCGGPAKRETDTMDTSSTRAGTSCATATPQRPRGVGSGRAEDVDAGRPVHRGRRARDPAPDVLAVLRQGARRHGPGRCPGAVSGAVHTGDDPRPRRLQDVELEGQRRCAKPIVERYGADAARCYVLFMGPPDQDAPWSDKGIEGVQDSSRGCGAGRRARQHERPAGRG